MSPAETALSDGAARLRLWLFESALPLWWERGADREWGGWHDQIAQDGTVPPVDRRCRVQARQTYVYAQAGRMGWSGPWREAAEHGLDYLRRRHRRPDSLYRTKVRPDGTPADDAALLYDQAFVLLALATLGGVSPDPDLEAEALALLAAIRSSFAFNGPGFREASPVPPFQSNPHMHLFEACMAWEDAGADPAWAALADEVAALALTRFIDAESGALREFFDADWRPAPGTAGREVWPGHQFEWAWLLERWGDRRGHADARAAARRLQRLARAHGVDADRNVAINGLWDDFSVQDPVARLWPQTERIKAALRLARGTSDAGEREGLLAEAARAVEGLELYLRTPIAGLWHDRLDASGRMIAEPAPASSFYHIVCAIAELPPLAGD